MGRARIREPRNFPSVENDDGVLVPSGWRGASQLSIAVHSDRGWYVAFAPITVMQANHLDGVVERVTFEPRAEALLVRVHYTQAWKWSESTYDALLFIGVGSSGAPSTIGPIVVAESREHDSHPTGPDDESVRHWMLADWRWEPHTFVVTAARGSPGRKRPALGRQPLVFR